MRFLIVFAVLALMTGAATIASAADYDPDALPLIASADDQKSDEKQSGEEQKKDEEPKESEKEEKKRYEKKERDQQEKKASDSTSDCFTACLADLFLSALFDGSDDQQATDMRSFEITDEYHEPLSGLIELEQEQAEEAMVWNIPGGEVAGSGIAFHVPVGEEVLIWKRAVALGDTAWLEISQSQMGTARGWVRAKDVVINQALEPAALVAGASSETGEIAEAHGSGLAAQPVAWLRADVSWYTFLGEPLWGEYDGRGYQFRAMAHVLTGWTLQFGAGVGYARGHGNPKVVYDSPSMFDEPLDSDLYILSLELQAGQLIELDEGDSFLWGIGPTLFKVKESATIAYTEIEDGQPGRSGFRTDTMTRWKLGLEGRLSLVHLVKGKYPMGVVTGFSFIPWDPNEKESLTLDWLGRDYFFTYQLGLSWGAMFF